MRRVIFSTPATNDSKPRQVKVFRKPVVAILSTGNELLDIEQHERNTDEDGSSSWSGIWDTNRPSLRAALEGLGYEVVDMGIAQDT